MESCGEQNIFHAYFLVSNFHLFVIESFDTRRTKVDGDSLRGSAIAGRVEEF